MARGFTAKAIAGITRYSAYWSTARSFLRCAAQRSRKASVRHELSRCLPCKPIMVCHRYIRIARSPARRCTARRPSRCYPPARGSRTTAEWKVRGRSLLPVRSITGQHPSAGAQATGDHTGAARRSTMQSEIQPADCADDADNAVYNEVPAFDKKVSNETSVSRPIFFRQRW
jgi:hypothetical protein